MRDCPCYEQPWRGLGNLKNLDVTSFGSHLPQISSLPPLVSQDWALMGTLEGESQQTIWGAPAAREFSHLWGGVLSTHKLWAERRFCAQCTCREQTPITPPVTHGPGFIYICMFVSVSLSFSDHLY